MILMWVLIIYGKSGGIKLDIALKTDVSRLVEADDGIYTVKYLYDKNNILSLVQVLDALGKIYKCLFYEDGKRLSNMSVYNTETGKEIKNITYKSDGKTISSVREYNTETEKLSCVTFYKPDGVSPSTIIEYDDYGDECQFTLYADDGEVITQAF